MNIHGVFHRFTISARLHTAGASSVCRRKNLRHLYKAMCTLSKEEAEAKDFFDFMDNLDNYEKLGLPKGSGTESGDGFDLGRMRRLMGLLGNPQCKFKSVHVAGTKGKGSTAAFLSGILRAEGYSVGCYTSPHIRTIRERITLGALGGPVPASLLNHHFQCVKMVLERAIELENGCLTHFEVLTALAFSLFAQQNVDIAVIEAGLGGARDATNVIPSSALAVAIITTIGEEHLAALGGSLESIAVAKSGIIKEGRPVVLGGPFLPHIEHILRDKASSMSSPVVSVSGTGNRSALRSHARRNGRPFQVCDLVLQIEKDLQLYIEMFDVKLSMLGQHQLQNAATATCAALCLREQGWNLSAESIRAGLQSAFLFGRNQILTPDEAVRLGLPGATIMLDGAHTKESATALVNTIKMAFPQSSFVLVVAMANDKDHIGFARKLLSGLSTPRVIFSIATEKDMNLLRFSLADTALKAVFFTEVSIAGEKSRTTSASSLRESWIQASKEKNTDVLNYSIDEHEIVRDLSFDQREGRAVIFSEGPLMACIRAGGQMDGAKTGAESVVVVTGSLHIVSAVLSSMEG